MTPKWQGINALSPHTPNIPPFQLQRHRQHVTLPYPRAFARAEPGSQPAVPGFLQVAAHMTPVTLSLTPDFR